MTFNLTCGEVVTELQNLANLCLSSLAESHQMQQKNFDVSPYFTVKGKNLVDRISVIYLHKSVNFINIQQKRTESTKYVRIFKFRIGTMYTKYEILILFFYNYMKSAHVLL